MNVRISHKQARVPVTVISIDGNIDASNTDQLDQMAFEEIGNGAQYILIDLAGVGFMSSAAFRSIMRIFYHFSPPSGEETDETIRKGINAGIYKSPNLKLCNPVKGVSEALKTAGFDMFLEIFTDINAAVASF